MTLSIKGVINSDGSISSGHGFRCQKAGQGFYAIEFDVPFDQAPIAVCLLQEDKGTVEAECSVSIINIATSQIVCATTTSKAPRDAAFKFIVLAHHQQPKNIGQNG